MSKRTIAYLEHGEHEPRVRTAQAISNALCIDDPRLAFPEAFDNVNGRPVGEPGGREIASDGGEDAGSG